MKIFILNPAILSKCVRAEVSVFPVCLCRLYSDPSNRPKYNLLFVLSGGGKFNYFGTKGLLEEQLEDSPLLSSVDYTLCLDSLLRSGDSAGLYLHVSKPPKEGSKAYSIVQALNQVCDIDAQVWTFVPLNSPTLDYY